MITFRQFSCSLGQGWQIGTLMSRFCFSAPVTFKILSNFYLCCHNHFLTVFLFFEVGIVNWDTDVPICFSAPVIFIILSNIHLCCHSHFHTVFLFSRAGWQIGTLTSQFCFSAPVTFEILSSIPLCCHNHFHTVFLFSGAGMALTSQFCFSAQCFQAFTYVVMVTFTHFSCSFSVLWGRDCKSGHWRPNFISLPQ